MQNSKSAQLDRHIRIDSRPPGAPALQRLSAILRMGSETDGRRYQTTPGSWRSEGACLQRFPERCGIGVAISEEIVGLDRVGVARAVSGVIAPRLSEPPLEAGGLCGQVPWASGWPGGLTDEPQSATLRRPVHAAADTERCCGDRLFGPISRAFSARHASIPPLRGTLRGGEGAVGGVFRAALRVLARLRRRAGRALPRLWAI